MFANNGFVSKGFSPASLPSNNTTSSCTLRVSLRTGIHCGNRLKRRGKRERTAGAADRDHLVFQRLAQRLKVARTKLGQFVEEEHASMRQADLARLGPTPAAHQPSMADRVMRRTKGSRAHQRLATGQRIGYGVDPCDFQRLTQGQARQDGGQGAGK